jgi:4-hydroxythreonine-4-phosphate dehydrogenase
MPSSAESGSLKKPGEGGTQPIFITMGEPSGIGPEVAVAAFHHFKGKVGGHPLRLVGDAHVFHACGIEDGEPLINTQPLSSKREPGRPDAANAPAVIDAIKLSVEKAMDGVAAAVVTAPIHKSVLNQAGFGFPGHTEFLAHLTGARRAVMMLASRKLRVVPLTIHMPVADVPKTITKQSVFDTGEIILTALRRDFGILNPRLAVAGLNPHAGEDSMLGGEDAAVIAPAVAALAARGFHVRGPLSADTLFHAEARKNYDAALCMYHDQALIPIKTLSFWDGVNVTLGLPIVRTSPDHGTALDIAGQGKADPRSMIAAVKMAADMADARSR